MMRISGLAAALLLGHVAAAQAQSCGRISAAFIFFGEQTTRAETAGQLDARIKRFAAGRPYKVSKRSIYCKSYLRLLNEYECHSFATVCRR